MLKDVAPFDRIWSTLHGSSRSAQAVASFIRFLEHRLGAEFIYDEARTGYEPPELYALFELAEALRTKCIIRSYGRNPCLEDEPRMAHWYAEYEAEGHKKSAGSTVDAHPLALTKTLVEAVERHIWFEYDQLPSLRSAPVVDMDDDVLSPERFASYSEAQRKNNIHLVK